MTQSNTNTEHPNLKLFRKCSVVVVAVDWNGLTGILTRIHRIICFKLLSFFFAPLIIIILSEPIHMQLNHSHRCNYRNVRNHFNGHRVCSSADGNIQISNASIEFQLYTFRCVMMHRDRIIVIIQSNFSVSRSRFWLWNFDNSWPVSIVSNRKINKRNWNPTDSGRRKTGSSKCKRNCGWKHNKKKRMIILSEERDC